MNFFGRFLLSYSVVIIISSLQTKAQHQSEEECVKKLVESCNKFDYFHAGTGSSILSTTDRKPSGEWVDIFCLSNTSGTSCYLDHLPWYSCSFDHSVTYKGELLSMSSTHAVDDDICYTSDRLAGDSIGNIFVKSKAHLEAKLKENEKRFNKQMADFQESMDRMNKKMQDTFQDCFPFCNNNPFGPGFPFNR